MLIRQGWELMSSECNARVLTEVKMRRSMSFTLEYPRSGKKNPPTEGGLNPILGGIGGDK